MLKPEDEIRVLTARIARSIELAKSQGLTCQLEAIAGVRLALDWVLCNPRAETFMNLCKAGLDLEESSLKHRTPDPSKN